MPDRNLKAGSATAAIATLLFIAGQDAAQAARCPLGEIYRPSRGICVSKQQAIQAGIYRGSAPSHVANLATEPASSAPTEVAPTPRVRPQALAEIERRAPAPKPKAEEALAFVPDRQPDGSSSTSSSVATLQVEAGRSRSQMSELAFRRPDPSPFGSLVALEPLP